MLFSTRSFAIFSLLFAAAVSASALPGDPKDWRREDAPDVKRSNIGKDWRRSNIGKDWKRSNIGKDCSLSSHLDDGVDLFLDVYLYLPNGSLILSLR
ncbi:hypothetical protein LshimejAT787_0307730 [Lyophyllum shimeji]|uniref:Uncharacterized protein n=1 Tax=Lyophyllum shimeji TaxID=47721 RepID=A0A9P3PIC0_LYOSH|nr:hypothetical protein LshimejAT787_0307730 [Lyophyllum shimeji]